MKSSFQWSRRAAWLTLLMGGAVVVLAQEPQPPTAGGEQQPAAATTEGQPKLELSTEEWDFGQVWSGEPATTEITIRNAGNAPLTITRVKTSCGCTAAKPSKDVLQPGETDVIKLSYNTKKNKEDVHQTVAISTNDPVRPVVSVVVKGTVKFPYTASPAALAFGRLTYDSEESKEMQIEITYDKPLDLKLKDEPGEQPYNLKLEEVEKGRKYKLLATTKPPLKRGAARMNAVLETGDEQVPEIVISVSGFVQPRVQVSPSRLYVPASMSREQERPIRITYDSRKPLKILEATASTDAIKVRVLEQRENRFRAAGFDTHELRAILPAGDQIPDGAYILIKTDDEDPEFREIKIPITTQRNTRRYSLPGAAQPQPAKGDDDHDHESGDE